MEPEMTNFVSLVIQRAICGAGNGPGSDDRPPPQGKGQPPKNCALELNYALREFNDFHEDSTT
jgi:hypothetical protein